ncbi:MAG TPA: DUF2059 domain-containing protein [Methylomirabilota bacterium]|nr:DUF2059 domain-containing protein [Methylomirabilota bacterium]
MRKLLLTSISIFVCCLAAMAQTGSEAPTSNPAPTATSPSSAQTAPATAQSIDPAKEADIRQLFEVMNAKQMQDQLVSTMLNQMQRQLMANQPQDERSQEFVNLIMTKLRRKFREADFLSPLIPLYDKYYSDDDIKELIAFYGTPLGQKYLKVAPNITAEGVTVGMQLGERLGEESAREVLQEHPEFAPRSH